MIDIPKDIEKYLVKDEVVEQEFKLKGRVAYATTKRLFVKKGSTIIDISYAHISSIEFKSKPQWLAILVGIVTGIVGYFLQQGTMLGWALIFVGILLIIVGFLLKSQYIKLNVVGLTNSPLLEGKGGTLDALFRLVRERRV